MRTKIINIYTFDELSEEAKDNARDWYRDGGSTLRCGWWDDIYDDAKTIGSLIGIVVDDIYFSGFSNQGDGACFDGSYSYKADALEAVKNYAPKDETLHRIAERLRELQDKNQNRLRATVKHFGRYYHALSVNISIISDIGVDVSSDDEECLKDVLRDFMNWIYRVLEIEYDYLMSDEAIDEDMRANGYEFDESGKIV